MNSCECLPGVGPAIINKLVKCGIHTVLDLLFHLPYRYQDRTRITPIQDVRVNDWCVIEGKITKTQIQYGKKKTFDCFVKDKTGLLKLRFFHVNNHQFKKIDINKRIRAFGEIRTFLNTIAMVHPQYQLIDDDAESHMEETLTPIYSTTQGLSQTRLRQLIKQALLLTERELKQFEWMTESQLQTHQFISINHALNYLHAPPPEACTKALEQRQHLSIKRLAFDELLARRLSMQFARMHRAQLKAPLLIQQSNVHEQFLNTLPFDLTVAQKRVFQEISYDLSQQIPMLRLIQGDVGSGKTVIAALAALQSMANGYQVAFMAPTDLLSEQHTQNLSNWLNRMNISTLRLNGKMKAAERKHALNAIRTHQCDMVIGTHALFQDSVCFSNLGLVIVDEQHRFGVEQRLMLQKKGQHESTTPHVLLMTATPIPRTLAMTHYAHMELSIIDELPPGRRPIITAVVNQEKRHQIINRLQDALSHGRQAYWVCTLIEDSEKLQCMAAIDTAKTLQKTLSNVQVGLLHGRMSRDEKDAVMAAFKRGELNLLVATTVIEVGVDVPNASLMIIENAERLGLSQLHQLRGRIGRGNTQSHCLLLYQSPLTQSSKKRLQVIRDTNDGFVIAEQDLQLRGGGDVLSARQTGYHKYKMVNLERDSSLLSPVATMATQLIQHDLEKAHAITKRWCGEFESFYQS